MSPKTTKIAAVGGAILLLFLGILIKNEVGAFDFIANLINGNYKEEFAKLGKINLPPSEEKIAEDPSLVHFKKCTFATSLSPSHNGAIFKEIAWMGTEEDPNNEWLTLEKRSAGDVDLSGSQIINQNERLKIVLPQGAILRNNKPLYTLSRKSKVSGSSPDFTFTGAIKNSNEGLRLFDNSCNLVDEVSANPDWPAGNSKTKKPMTRLTDLSWQTKGETKVTQAVSPIVVAAPACVNINLAPKPDLIKITRVGEKLADQIIELRGKTLFSSVDDLIRVRGIGTTTLVDIKKQGVACVE